MCIVAAPLIMAGISIGLAATQASLQAAGQAKYATQESQALNSNLRNQYQQANQQIIYRDDAAFQKLDANSKALRAAQGKLQAAASDNGVGGNSIFALGNELNANAAHYASDVELNRTASDEEIQLQMQGMQAQTQSQLNMLPRPSPLEALASVGASGLSAYNTYFPQNKGLQIPVDDNGGDAGTGWGSVQ